MFELYVTCLIIGGGLLGFSMLAGGGDADTDASSGGDVHSLDSGSDITHIDVHAHADIHAHADVQNEHLPTHADAAAGVKLLSIRNSIYFIAFFGLTGTVLTFFGFSFFSTLLSAIGLGGFSAYFGYRLLRYLKGSETGEAINLLDAKGMKAKVSLPISRSRRGKIYLEIKGQTTEIPAEISDAAESDNFKLRDEVLVVKIENGVAKVIEVDI